MKFKKMKLKNGLFIAALTLVFLTGFSGGTKVSAASPGVTGFVTRLYQLCLNRDPDSGGLNFWVDGLGNGTFTGADTSVNFIFSPEFISKNVTDDEFLNIMYRAFFNREPDAGGKAYWAGKLSSGISRLYINASFVNSAEFNTVCTTFGINRGSVVLTKPADLHPEVAAFTYRFYDKCLNRKPDDIGLNYWVNNLTTGTNTGADISLGFVFSPEFTGKNLPDRDFVVIMYRVFFDRGPDSGGQAFWEGKLADGYSRRYVLASFAASQEFKGICGSYGINNGTVALTKADLPGEYGFRGGNIENIGLVASEGDWIYYANPSDGFLYKMKSDNTGKTLVYNDTASFINVLNGWIYYRNDSDAGSLYKIKTDGTSRTKMNSDNAMYIYAAGQTIYYCNYTITATTMTSELYSINTDGTGRKLITELISGGMALDVIFDGQWFYYIDLADFSMYKIQYDGSGKTKINTDISSGLTKCGDWIFYINGSDGGKLYKIKTDGTGKTLVTSEAISCLNVYGDWIFYSFDNDAANPAAGGKLYKIRVDGTEKTWLTDDAAFLLNVAGNSLYYFSISDTNVYKVNMDGTGRVVLN